MSEQHHHHPVLSSTEITYAAPHKDDAVKRFMKVTWILSIITIIELVLGFGLAKHWYGDSAGFILFIKGAICILSLAKAYYIVSVFMHLGDEIRNFIMTIVVPLTLFIWFIIAFLYDGESWKDLRNTEAGSKPDQTEIRKEKPAAIEKGAKD
jgi:cytochrome c oxidase subunit IV